MYRLRQILLAALLAPLVQGVRDETGRNRRHQRALEECECASSDYNCRAGAEDIAVGTPNCQGLSEEEKVTCLKKCFNAWHEEACATPAFSEFQGEPCPALKTAATLHHLEGQIKTALKEGTLKEGIEQARSDPKAFRDQIQERIHAVQTDPKVIEKKEAVSETLQSSLAKAKDPHALENIQKVIKEKGLDNLDLEHIQELIKQKGLGNLEQFQGVVDLEHIQKVINEKGAGNLEQIQELIAQNPQILERIQGFIKEKKTGLDVTDTQQLDHIKQVIIEKANPEVLKSKLEEIKSEVKSS